MEPSQAKRQGNNASEGRHIKLDILASVCSIGADHSPTENDHRRNPHGFERSYSMRPNSAAQEYVPGAYPSRYNPVESHYRSNSASSDLSFPSNHGKETQDENYHRFEYYHGHPHDYNYVPSGKVNAFHKQHHRHQSPTRQSLLGDRDENTNYSSAEHLPIQNHVATTATSSFHGYPSNDANIERHVTKRNHVAVLPSNQSSFSRDPEEDFGHRYENGLTPDSLPVAKKRKKQPAAFSPLSVSSSQQTKKPRKQRSDHRTRWGQMFEDLQNFKAMHGDCLVPCSYPPNPALSQWVTTQRSMYRARNEGLYSTMTDERLKTLESIGFVWAVQGQTTPWEVRYKQLCDYKEAHGTCSISRRDKQHKKLAEWVRLYVVIIIFFNGNFPYVFVLTFLSYNWLCSLFFRR